MVALIKVTMLFKPKNCLVVYEMSACCSKKTVRLGKQKGIQDILVFFRKEDTGMRQYEYTFTAQHPDTLTYWVLGIFTIPSFG